ncbi:MAG: LamG domain-containing protein [Ferruginibacter sp.]
MKKMYLFFYTTLISIIANAQVLIASYPLDGNANDATGSANGTVNGATLTTDRFGNANSAYYFDGVNSYIEAIADALPTGDNSISVWFNADAGSIAGRPGLLGYGGNTSGSCPGNSDLLIINLSGSGKYVTQAHCLDNYADFTYSSLPENNWYNWVVTKSGTTIKMFINGVLVSTENNATQPVIVSGKKLSIGAVVGPNGFANFTDANVGHFKGKLDDIKIYNGALTDAQIINAYMDNLRKPGSGNAILFDNTLKQIVDVGNGFDQAGSFSFETWVKRTSTAITDINSQTFMASQLNNGWSVGINQSAPADRIYFSKVGISQVVSVSSITDTKWHHVAVTYNSSTNQVVFYIDGIADAPISYSPGGFNSGNTNYRLAGRNNGVNFDNNLNGMLDEVRVWSDVVLTQDEIRGWMCKKINPSHPEYANLQGYFMLDEGSNTLTSGYN